VYPAKNEHQGQESLGAVSVAALPLRVTRDEFIVVLSHRK
jgi:hypothetical protein